MVGRLQHYPEAVGLRSTDAVAEAFFQPMTLAFAQSMTLQR